MKHYIIVKLKDKAMLPELSEKAESIFSETLSIEGIRSVKVHTSCSDISNRYDLMIEMDMTPEALSLYVPCEPHQRWKALCDPLMESKVIFDCEE